MNIGFWCRNLKERDHFEGPSTDRRILKCVLRRWGRRVWNGLICLRSKTSERPLQTQK